MNRNVVSFILLAVFCILPLAVQAQEAEENQVEELQKFVDLKRVNSFLVSPNGEWVLYAVRETDWEENRYLTQLWLAETETGESRQMTFYDVTKWGYDWMPDSSAFTFIMDTGDGPQVHAMAVDGGGARPITSFEKGISGYQFNADGSTMYYTRAAEEDPEKSEVAEKYGSFNFHDTEYGRTELWTLDMESGETSKLLGEEGHSIMAPALSPDESKLAYMVVPDNKLIRFQEAQIYIYDFETGEEKLVVDDTYPVGAPVWSPDSSSIAFGSSLDEEKIWFKNNHIVSVDIETGELTNYTDNFDESISPSYWREEGIYFRAYQGMESGIFKIDTASGEIIRITPDDDHVYSNPSISRNADVAAFLMTTATEFTELYVTDLTAYDPVQLSNLGEQTEDWQLASKEGITWKSTDGAEISGVLIKPADFDPEKKYPLLVIIHGGPTGIDYPMYIDGLNGFAYPVEEFADRGAIILMPNYRGSAGFGEEFRSLNYRNLGVGDYWDVISGVDHLIEQGYIDTGRIGSMGWSQGGYISAFITTYSDRFAAVSVGAGISDWVDYYYRTDITPFTRVYLGDDPWDDPDIYDKTSPMTYIKSAQTPTLIQHGERDARVPINNAYKLYRGLMDQEVPVYFAIYHGFGHGINKPKENLAAIVHNWNFFGKYIWGDDVDVMEMPLDKADEEAEEDSGSEEEDS